MAGECYTCLYKMSSYVYSLFCLETADCQDAPSLFLSYQVLPTYNCKESSYRYRLNIDDKTTLTNSTSTSRTIYRDGNVDVSAEVWLIQRNGDLSASVKKSIVTKQGLRMFSPFLFRLLNCV